MLKVPWSEKSLEPLLQSSWPTCRKKYAFLSFTCSPNTRSRHRIAFKSWCISLFSWILIGFDNFNFELLRNFQFSFWTTDYCIEKFGSVEFLKSVGIVHCVCSKCWTLTITIWYKSPLLRRRSQGAQGGIPPKHAESFCALRSSVPNKNTVARIKSNILVPPKFWAGYASALLCIMSSKLRNSCDFHGSSPFSWLIIVIRTGIPTPHNI